MDRAKRPFISNYHSHCLYCDGRAAMEEFVRFALSKGFSSYGFSSHAPLPFSTPCNMEWDRMEDYLSEFFKLKNKYNKDIELLIGLEIDYINEKCQPASICYQTLPLDYRIGSVHMLLSPSGKVVDMDTCPDTFARLVNEFFEKDIVYVLCLYYRSLMRMVETGGFDIVGHMDKIHYNASCYHPGLLDESWYNRLVYECFETIVRRGYIIEINTKSYHDLGVFYPNERYFPLLQEIGARIQINSDAHYPDCILSGRIEALEALKRAGFKEQTVWHNGHWEQLPLE